MLEVPFAHQWQIAENLLLPLKDSENGCLISAPVTNVPEFEYSLRIYPNGWADDCRGEIWIFLELKFKHVKKVEVERNSAIESANFSYTFHRIYEQSECSGHSICKANIMSGAFLSTS